MKDNKSKTVSQNKACRMLELDRPTLVHWVEAGLIDVKPLAMTLADVQTVKKSAVYKILMNKRARREAREC